MKFFKPKTSTFTNLSVLVLIGFVFLFFRVDPSVAQTAVFNPYLQGGIVAAQFDGDQFGGYNRLGLRLGIGTEVDFDREYTFSFAILLTQKGAVDPPNAQIGKYTFYRFKANYIDIPLLFRYEVLDKLTLLAGLSPNILINKTESDQNGTLNQGYINLKPFDLAASLGLQYQVKDNIAVQATFDRSLLPVSSRITTTSFGIFGSGFHRFVSFSVVYSLSKN